MLKSSELPGEMEWLFWDCDPKTLGLPEHNDFLIQRILVSGDWEAIVWLRQTIGDDLIREWFLSKNGGGLDPRRLRFWGLILDLPAPLVDEWVDNAKLSHWLEKAIQ